MSRDIERKSGERQEVLTKELRQFTGLAAALFRTAATRAGMTVTDMQVIDLLESGGPATAGQLADLTGLTTGAITGMLNRLEEAGLVRRERDPNDGRRVIVRLERGKDEMGKIGTVFEVLGKSWGELVAGYDEEQAALLLEFLRRSNMQARREIIRLQEAVEEEGKVFSAPLGGLESGRLVVSSGLTQLNLRAGKGMGQLYQASFEGPQPNVKVKEGTVTIRYPRGVLVSLGMEKRIAVVTLNNAIPWQIDIQGGAAVVTAELGHLKLSGLEVKGGMSAFNLELPVPRGVVPVRISGGASEIHVRRPAGVATRAHLKGWVSSFIFDDQMLSEMGNNAWLQSKGFNRHEPYYDIEVASSASSVVITEV